MKKSLIFMGLLAIGYANAQEGRVGVNTSSPQATLDILPHAKNSQESATTNEGILAPKLSKSRVANIASTNLVEGTLVYITDDSSSPISAYTGANDKVTKITEKGYYVYNGTEWIKMVMRDGLPQYTSSASVVLDGGSFQRAALTGDVTAAKNDNTVTINNGAVTSEKLNQMGAKNMNVLQWSEYQQKWVPRAVIDRTSLVGCVSGAKSRSSFALPEGVLLCETSGNALYRGRFEIIRILGTTAPSAPINLSAIDANEQNKIAKYNSIIKLPSYKPVLSSEGRTALYVRGLKWDSSTYEATSLITFGNAINKGDNPFSMAVMKLTLTNTVDNTSMEEWVLVRFNTSWSHQIE